MQDVREVVHKAKRNIVLAFQEIPSQFTAPSHTGAGRLHLRKDMLPEQVDAILALEELQAKGRQSEILMKFISL